MKANHQNLIHPEKEENNIRIKKIAMRYILYWACLGLLVLAGCKGCDDKITPEPYPSRKLPVLADFKMCVDYDTGAGRALFEVTDTTSHLQLVFAANDTTGDVYEWQIGEEPSPRYGKTVSVYFRDQLGGGNGENPNATYPFKVKLKVTRTRNPYKADSIAAKERNFMLESSRRTFSKWRGDYIAHYTYAPNETFLLRIFDTTRQFGHPGGCLNIKYLKANCDKPVRMEFYGNQYTSASPIGDEQGNAFCYPDTGYWTSPGTRWFGYGSFVFFSNNGRILNIQYFRRGLKNFVTQPINYYVIKAYRP